MMKERFCVIGRDVSRSPSPAMMSAGFRYLRIDAEYTAVSVPEAKFAREFGRLMKSRFKGMNVTIPFKTAVIPLLGGLDPVATRIQAVNSVRLEADGRYNGYNTDPDGIVGPLRDVLPSVDVRNALLIGAGGAARAFCEAMNRVGCVDVGVAVRDVERARRFAQEMEMAFPRLNITLAQMGDLHHLNHDLVFNASPMGAAGEPLPRELKRILPGTKVAFDAVYLPRQTRLLREAERNGSRVIHGEEMLLYQGMAALSLWTGRVAPEKVMREALKASLSGGVKRAKRGRGRR